MLSGGKMLEEYKDVLTVNDLKEILHYRSNTTVYKLLNNNVINAVHLKGNKWLIPKQNVISYLLDNTDSRCYNLQYILK